MSIIDTLIFDRTGGYYNATDLNRVGSAIAYIAARLAAAGYVVPVNPKTDWTVADIPTPAQMTAYLVDVAAIRAALATRPITPAVPPDMDDLTVEEANDIERILQDVNALVTAMTGVTLYAPIHTANGARLRLPEQLLELRDSDGYWLLDADGKQLEARCV